jgi:hypothetical protein
MKLNSQAIARVRKGGILPMATLRRLASLTRETESKIGRTTL